VTFPPGSRPIDPDAEAARLAHARKETSYKVSVSAQCTGCPMHGNADGVVYVAQFLHQCGQHAASTGHEVKIEGSAEPAGE
jgi:hypothetical protein